MMLWEEFELENAENAGPSSQASESGSGRRLKRLSSSNIDPDNFQCSNPSGADDFFGSLLDGSNEKDVEVEPSFASQLRELAELETASFVGEQDEEKLRTRFCDWYGKNDDEKESVKLSTVSHSFDAYVRRVEVILSRSPHPSPAVEPAKKRVELKKRNTIPPGTSKVFLAADYFLFALRSQDTPLPVHVFFARLKKTLSIERMLGRQVVAEPHKDFSDVERKSLTDFLVPSVDEVPINQLWALIVGLRDNQKRIAYVAGVGLRACYRFSRLVVALASSFVDKVEVAARVTKRARRVSSAQTPSNQIMFETQSSIVVRVVALGVREEDVYVGRSDSFLFIAIAPDARNVVGSQLKSSGDDKDLPTRFTKMMNELETPGWMESSNASRLITGKFLLEKHHFVLVLPPRQYRTQKPGIDLQCGVLTVVVPFTTMSAEDRNALL
jgi:hypothetical protein